MRSLKFALKQKQTRSRTQNPCETVNEMVQPYLNAFEERKKSEKNKGNIFLDSEEALVWIKKQFSRKNKNDFLEIIRKRNVDEMIKKTGQENTVAINGANNRKVQSLQKRKDYKTKETSNDNIIPQRLHSWQDRRFSLSKKKYQKCGFLTIQALDMTERRQQSEVKMRVRKSLTRGMTSERNRTQGQKKAGRQQGGSRRKTIPKVKYDQESFHISLLSPWE